jgi:assimilatory nitrate reductase catalytic subunit
VRDQWHTMTRTGKAARLVSHIAEPFAEIHPEDADQLGINAADIVEVKSPHGKVLVRALVTDRVCKGQIYVPMHWTDQLASCARIDTVVAPETDPQSGQPGSKFTPVSVSKKAMDWFGFAVLKQKPAEIPGDYWVLAPVSDGYRLEFAGQGNPDFNALAGIKGTDTADCLRVEDTSAGWSRRACWNNDVLEAAVFVSKEPVEVSRQWACGLLSSETMSKKQRFQVLAGRAPADRPDLGAIVCSCFQVGCNQISEAVKNGADSVQKIGTELKAGTNCGSCRSEIQSQLDNLLKEAMHDADLAQAG